MQVRCDVISDILVVCLMIPWVVALRRRQKGARQDDTIISTYNGLIMVRFEAGHCFRDKALCPMDVYDCLVSRFTELTSRTVSKREC